MSVRRSSGDRSVSPVVGIALLVAITVLLVATAGVFFTDIGPIDPEDGTPPIAAFGFDYSTDGTGEELSISHASGDPVAMDTLHVVVSNAECRDPTGPASDPNGRYGFGDLGATGDRSVAGTTASVDSDYVCGGGDHLVLGHATVSVVWIDGSNSKEFVVWRGPYE